MTDPDVTVLRVGDPGITTVQDLGRPGFSRVGIGLNGAGDRHAAAVAAALVGNAPGSPLLETTATGWSFTLDRPALVAVTGAADRVTVAGQPQPAWQTLVVPADRPMVVEPPDRGWRTYVAIGGALEAERTLGSVAPDPLLGVGTRLEAGEFAPDTWETLGEFEVGRDSDYVGLRLLGDAPARRGGAEMISRGVPIGAVEVPPTDGLLVLLRGRLVTAGYPVLGVATTVATDRLAQARPGDRIRFRPCSTADAVADARRDAAALVELTRRVQRALRASGVERLH